jgi:hypothetical protein
MRTRSRASEHCLRPPALIEGESHASSSATMTVPYYISEDKSDMRGIKRGWYAMEDDGDLSSGPFSSHEECVSGIIRPTNGTMVSKLLRGPN